ncbi:MAG: arabinosyltransferase domain-containing protein, partial [Pseudonocardiaceae bacterium]
AAIPLMPYQPVQLTATVPCPGSTADTVLLSTVPLRPDPGAPPLPGLRVEQIDGDLVVSSYGEQVASASRPPGSCTVEIRSDPDRTTVTLDGQRVGLVAGDVRPVVAGAFTEAPDLQAPSAAGLRVTLVTDTRFQTSMTPVKATLVALSGLALLGALLAVARLDNRSDRTRRAHLLPRRWWRPRAVDMVVTAGLAVWAVMGPITVDDGYISGIVRTRDASGYIGNLYRWLNAPEAPFGWFYELYHLWSQISAAPLWMRIPSTVLGVLCWLLLSRALLPRLGTFAARPATVWVAAATFAAWWLPFNLGLRSEPWIAVAGLVTLLAVERAVVTRRLLPVLLGLVVAAAATAVAPTGIVVFTPLLAGLVPLLQALRQRPELTRSALLVLLIAAPGSALLLGFADQSLAAVAEATRIRALIGGDLPWHREIERYASLLTPGSVEGPLQRRVPVLLTLLGLAGIAWFLSRRPMQGMARGPVVRVSVTLVLSLVALTFTPTKWTYHFGALAGVGSAVLVVALYAWSRRTLARATARPLAAAAVSTAALAVGAGVALAGFNQWPYVSNYGITWSTLAPQLGGVQASAAVLIAGLVLAAVSGGAAAWALAGGRTGGGTGSMTRSVPSPGLLALAVVVATVALQFGSVARAGLEQRTSYSLAGDSVAALTGSSCGLADHLRVETDPRAGLLTPSTGGDLDGFRPADATSLQMSGVALPGWTTTGTGEPARGHTPWYRLRDPAAPVVVTVSGELGPGGSLVAEFGGASAPVTSVKLADRNGAAGSQADAPRDIRIAVPDVAADHVRLSVTAYPGPGTAALTFSAPRSPRTTPMNEVVPPGTEAVVDWPVAFLYPCLTIAGTPEGTATLPRWRVGTPAADDSGGIVTAPHVGGPFATARALVRAEQLPVYLDGDPMRDVGTLHRWTPITALSTPPIARVGEVRWGWQHDGYLQVPALDQ